MTLKLASHSEHTDTSNTATTKSQSLPGHASKQICRSSEIPSGQQSLKGRVASVWVYHPKISEVCTYRAHIICHICFIMHCCMYSVPHPNLKMFSVLDFLHKNLDDQILLCYSLRPGPWPSATQQRRKFPQSVTKKLSSQEEFSKRLIQCRTAVAHPLISRIFWIWFCCSQMGKNVLIGDGLSLSLPHWFVVASKQ